jgi:hypothetical protein
MDHHRMAVHFTRSSFEGFKTAVYAVHLIGLTMILCGMTVNMLGRVAASGRTAKMDNVNNDGGECDGDW